MDKRDLNTKENRETLATFREISEIAQNHGFEILDTEHEDVRNEINTLEQKAYGASGYQENAEQGRYWQRIDQQPRVFHFGMRNPDSKALEYYTCIRLLDPNELTFPEEKNKYTALQGYPLTFPGIVFNKILKKDPKQIIPEATKLTFSLIKLLLEKSDQGIRFEEQCQPDSYRLIKMIASKKLMNIFLDESSQINGTEVHQIFATINNNPQIVSFLTRATQTNER